MHWTSFCPIQDVTKKIINLWNRFWKTKFSTKCHIQNFIKSAHSTNQMVSQIRNWEFMNMLYIFWFSSLDECLVQLIEHPILWIPNFNFPNLRCRKVCVCVLYNELYWHFWVYFDINLKLLSGKNTQKVNKQNIRVS